MKNKIKIAYIVKNLNVNGVSTVVVDYARGLDSDKYQIDIYAGEPISNISVKKLSSCENVKVIKTPTKNIKNIFKYVCFLKKMLKGYDIVHVHGNSRTITLELLIAKSNNKSLVAHCHSVSCSHKIIHRLLWPVFKRIYSVGIAPSKKAGEWMFGDGKYTVVRNGIEVSKYAFDYESRKEIRSELGIAENEIVIGHVGNFSKEKNYEYILEIFDDLCKKSKRYKLLLVGKYQNNKKLCGKIKKNNNANRIMLYGATNELYKVYNAMDCFIMPSKFEGFGIVALEAQVSGLPCILSSRIPNETKVHKNTQYMNIFKRSVKEWSKAISEIEYKERRGAWEYCNDKCDVRSCIDDIDSIYADIMRAAKEKESI